MKWIAHRGNLNGPNTEEENKPEYILKALKSGYDVEIDVWLLNDKLYLGHDSPKYEINRYLLQDSRIWSHCKNMDAYLHLLKFKNVNCFFQEDEMLVNTSRGYIWAHSNCDKSNNKTVITCLNGNYNKELNPYAICSDFIKEHSFVDLPFDLLILDIDGVMTDGKKLYDINGKILAKNYCDLDFTAIKRFLAAGITVCFLSGDKNINENMARIRKIPFYYNEAGKDKVDILQSLKEKYNANKIAYVGDDYYDTSIMNCVDLAFCPKNSPNFVKKCANIVIDAKAGDGVIAKLYDLFESQIPSVYPVDSIDVNP